jgi:phosphatidylglycerol lysyltransferase
MVQRVRAALPAALGVALFVIALGALHAEVRMAALPQLTSDLVSTGHRQLIAALLLTAVNYAALTGYDFLAFASIGRRLPVRHVALTSFVAYAIANNVGWAMFSGASVRYRFYSRWGVTAEELARIVFSCSVTFWIGLLILGGLSLAASPLPAALDFPFPRLLAPIGWLFVALSLAYVASTAVWPRPRRVLWLDLPLPRPRVAVAQLAVSLFDWMVAGAVLYVLLPSDRVPFFTLLGAFVAAQLLALASHVPGGVGVFEAFMILLLKPFLGSSELLPALAVYRAVYYICPLAVSVVVLLVDALHQRRAQTLRVGAALGRATERLTPRMVAAFTFLSGAILLFSGATPAAAGRLAMLGRVVPLGVIETSHFAGSLVGVALLLLSQGLARRLDAAYFLTVGAMLMGIAASLLKGGDYEEATILFLALLVLWRARPAFDRRAALFDTRYSASWIVAMAGVVAASVWLGLFAFKHVEYSNQLWWQFELRGDASRFLRATVGVAVAFALFGFARLIGRAPHHPGAPKEDDLEAAGPIIAAQTATLPYLVYLRDKALLFNEARTGFVMYGVQGRTWAALGDPVGPPAQFSSLVRAFLEQCDDFGGIPIFYEVRKENLYRYADFGLAFVKLGEHASVDLRQFTLQGGRASKRRQAVRRLEKEGATFRVVAGDEIQDVIEQLRAVSDDWLQHKGAAEKGFSLGFFDPVYLSRFPVGVIEQHGRVVAFANMWPGPQKQELSLDLMRYDHRAPVDVMEALFAHLMTWGRDHGYERFSFGMAPLSGFERSPIAPLWNQLGSFVYQHGESLYRFQGLRAYKEKFHPEWEPRYLVYPGGLQLPRILVDVAALIAGGYRRLLLTGADGDRGRPRAARTIRASDNQPPLTATVAYLRKL